MPFEIPFASKVDESPLVLTALRGSIGPRRHPCLHGPLGHPALGLPLRSRFHSASTSRLRAAIATVIRSIKGSDFLATVAPTGFGRLAALSGVLRIEAGGHGWPKCAAKSGTMNPRSAERSSTRSEGLSPCWRLLGLKRVKPFPAGGKYQSENLSGGFYFAAKDQNINLISIRNEAARVLPRQKQKAPQMRRFFTLKTITCPDFYGWFPPLAAVPSPFAAQSERHHGRSLYRPQPVAVAQPALRQLQLQRRYQQREPRHQPTQ